MEQIKLMNGNKYELVVNGIEEVNDILRLTIVDDFSTFDLIEKDFENSDNISRIEILDVTGEPMEIKREYTVLEAIKKDRNYMQSTKNDDGITYTDVTRIAYTIILSKGDLRKQVQTLQDTVDMLVLSELGGK